MPDDITPAAIQRNVEAMLAGFPCLSVSVSETGCGWHVRAFCSGGFVLLWEYLETHPPAADAVYMLWLRNRHRLSMQADIFHEHGHMSEEALDGLRHRLSFEGRVELLADTV